MNIDIPKLNVNVGLYIISLIAIGLGEFYDLHVTFWAGLATGIVSFISILICIIPYTIDYVRKRSKNKEPKQKG